jgi:hypothetical protein
MIDSSGSKNDIYFGAEGVRHSVFMVERHVGEKIDEK